jgi:hypothetical protein
MNTEDKVSSPPSADDRRPFVDPAISDPVEVVKGNPAASVLFAAAGSGIPGP